MVETSVAADARNGLDGREPLTADSAAIGQNGASTLGGVPAQEAVLPFPADFGRLILPFHSSFLIRASEMILLAQKPRLNHPCSRKARDYQ